VPGLRSGDIQINVLERPRFDGFRHELQAFAAARFDDARNE
jgi:hypothetical protein